MNFPRARFRSIWDSPAFRRADYTDSCPYSRGHDTDAERDPNRVADTSRDPPRIPMLLPGGRDTRYPAYKPHVSLEGA